MHNTRTRACDDVNAGRVVLAGNATRWKLSAADPRFSRGGRGSSPPRHFHAPSSYRPGFNLFAPEPVECGPPQAGVLNRSHIASLSDARKDKINIHVRCCNSPYRRRPLGTAHSQIISILFLRAPAVFVPSPRNEIFMWGTRSILPAFIRNWWMRTPWRTFSDYSRNPPHHY